MDVGSNITLLNTPTLESIEEFKIITSSYAAEWPRSGGGIVNVVTKSGTNEFRVSAYEFFRNDALNANSFIRKQTGCTADATGSVTCLDRSANGATDFAAIRDNPPALDYNNFGFTVGGPIKKDKLFFFYSQEWRKISRAPTDRTAIVPEASWLTDPANPNYVAPADRDPNAVRLLAAVAGCQRGDEPVPRPPAQRAGHAAGGRARRLHDLAQVAADGPLHARPERDHGAGRPVLQHRHPERGHHAHRRARPGVRRPAHHHPQPEHVQRAVAAVLEQRDQVRATATT